MAATVNIVRHTGTNTSGGQGSIGATVTSVTGGTNRMAASDSPTDGIANPIPIPSGGSINYSYWVSSGVQVSVYPANQINNIKWYTDGTSFGTGLTCSGINASGGSYGQATGTAGTSGSILSSTNYNNRTTGTVTATTGAVYDVTTKTSAATQTVAGSVGSATVTGGYFGDMIVYQLAVASNAGVGTMTARTITWQYDES